jgi:hypothetical protein
MTVPEKIQSDPSNSVHARDTHVDALHRPACARCDEEIMAWRSLNSIALMLPRVSPP